MKNLKKSFLLFCVLFVIASSSLFAHYYKPFFPRRFFSLGIGLGSDMFAMTLDEQPDVRGPQNMRIDFEFSLFPQYSDLNCSMRISSGLFQKSDVLGNQIIGATFDSSVLLRYQHSSGFAFACGGGAFIPGFNENAANAQPQAIIEPSFAFNLNPNLGSESMGVFRLSAPVAFRCNSNSNNWYMTLSLLGTFYII